MAKETASQHKRTQPIHNSPVSQPATSSKKKGIWTSISNKFKSFDIGYFATLGPLGFFPKGPGTIGSLVALPVAYLLNKLYLPALWIFALIMFFVGLKAVQKYTADKVEKDPGCVIIDEFVGQMIPFMVIIPELLHASIIFLAFALFRLFDIFKFGPVAMYDRRKNPVGVMMDDVVAGIFAGFILAMLQLCIFNNVYGM